MKMRKIVAIAAAALMLFSIMPFSAMADSSVTLTFDDTAKRTVFTTECQQWEENGIVLTNNKGNSTSPVADYASPARFYKSSQIIVYYPTTMNTIIFHCNTAAYATALANSIGADLVIVEDKDVYYHPQTTEYAFELTGGQVRMDGITVQCSDTICEHEYEYECSEYCKLCGVRTRPAAQCVNNGPACTDGVCQYCGVAVAGLGHAYDNDYDADCNYCGEVREVEEAPDGYVLMTSLSIGDTVTLVAESASKELGGISTTSTKYGLGVAYVGAPVGAYPLTVEAGYNDSTYSFKTGDGKYLYWTSGNSLNVTTTKDAKSSWTVTFEGNNVMIVNASDSTRKIRWNTSSPRFATYTSAQTDIQLYGISAGGESGCAHEYDNDCDTDCNLCGEVRVAGHAWDSCADTDCNKGCGYIREASDCVYTSAYDTSCSECGATRAVELPAADSELTIPEANDVAMLGGSAYTSGKYYVTGVVESIANTTYGNLYIQDENGNKLYVYGVYGPDGTTRYDSLGDLQPAVGDEITLYGPLGTYSGAGQMKNGSLVVETTVCDECTYSGDYDPTCNVCFTEREITLPEADTELTFEEIEEIATGRDHNDYTDSKYYVTGTVTEVTSDVYGNMTIEDEAGNVLTIYGTYSADGSTRYDAMETKPVVGDTVKLYGIIGNYNGTVQMKNAWVIEHTAHTCVSDSEYECTDGVCTICGAAVAGIGHSYFYPCDVVCQICYQETNPDAAHTIVAVEAVEATCSQNGNIAYWYCSDCGYVWADEALTQQTNRMNIVVPATGEHTYDDDYDADCNVCGETREVPEIPVEILYGDADGDGEVTLTDAALLGQWLAGYEVTVNEAAADADGDGEVTLTDAALLGQWLAGYDVTLGPAEPPTFNDATLGWE